MFEQWEKKFHPINYKESWADGAIISLMSLYKKKIFYKNYKENLLYYKKVYEINHIV